MFNQSLLDGIDSRVRIYSKQSHSEIKKVDEDSSGKNQTEFPEINEQLAHQDYEINEKLVSKVQSKLTAPFKRSKVNFNTAILKTTNESRPEKIALYAPKTSYRRTLTKTVAPGTFTDFQDDPILNKITSAPERFERKAPHLKLAVDERDSLHRTHCLTVRTNHFDFEPKEPSLICRSYFFQKATPILSLGETDKFFDFIARDSSNCFFFLADQTDKKQSPFSEFDEAYLCCESLSVASKDRDGKIETPKTRVFSKSSLEKLSSDFQGEFKKVSKGTVRNSPNFLSNDPSLVSNYNSHQDNNKISWQEETLEIRVNLIDVRDGDEHANPHSLAADQKRKSLSAQNSIYGIHLLRGEPVLNQHKKDTQNAIPELISPIDYATFAPIPNQKFESVDSSNYDSNYCDDNIKSLNFFLDNKIQEDVRRQFSKNGASTASNSWLPRKDSAKHYFAKDKNYEKYHPNDLGQIFQVAEFKYFDLIGEVNQSQSSPRSHDQLPLSNFSSNKMNSVEMSDITKSEMETRAVARYTASPVNSVLKGGKSLDNLDDVSELHKPSFNLTSFIDDVRVHSFDDDSDRYSRRLELHSFRINEFKQEGLNNSPFQALAKDAIDDQLDSKHLMLQRGHSESIIGLHYQKTDGARNFSFRQGSSNL